MLRQNVFYTQEQDPLQMKDVFTILEQLSYNNTDLTTKIDHLLSFLEKYVVVAGQGKHEVAAPKQKIITKKIINPKYLADSHQLNELQKLWVKVVNEVKLEIMKRNNMNLSKMQYEDIGNEKFTKFDKIEAMSKFFAQERVIAQLDSSMLNKKCCTHLCNQAIPAIQTPSRLDTDGRDRRFQDKSLDRTQIINPMARSDYATHKRSSSHN